MHRWGQITQIMDALTASKIMITNSIKIYREKSATTQEELASAVGVSRQTIIAMEKGNYEPSLGLAIKLARFFKVAVERLFMLK